MRRIILFTLLGVLFAVALPVSADIIGTGAPESAAPPDIIGTGESAAPPDIIGTGESAAPPDIIGTGEPASDGSSLWNAFWMMVSL
ncbi:MAG TPA: hypothetical protein VFP95_07445 [Gammaproteobacteria bacterium]|nr:hypothetical protein [Gammaproteobacteria bacterium]